MKRFLTLLDELTLGLDNRTLTLDDTSERMCRFIQAELHCSQATVWLLEATAQGPALRRQIGYDGVAGLLIPPQPAMCHPRLSAYVEELTHRGVFVSDDAMGDERLAPLRESFLVPERIGALMYAAIGANGSTWALFGCAQCGAPRHWTAHEQRMLKAYADAISVRRARRRRREAEAATFAQRLLLVEGRPPHGKG